MRRDPPSRGRRRLSNLVGVALLVALLLIGLRFARDADSVEQQRLYPRNDPWAAYLAPEAACPGGEDRSAAIAVQEHTMLCLLNWARGRRGLSPIPESSTLSLAARLKAEDIQRCGDFAHDACGKKPDDVAHEPAMRDRRSARTSTSGRSSSGGRASQSISGSTPTAATGRISSVLSGESRALRCSRFVRSTDSATSRSGFPGSEAAEGRSGT
jgi:hypothetical protein